MPLFDSGSPAEASKLSDLNALGYRLACGREDAELVDRIHCMCGEEITARIGEGHWTRSSDVPSVQQSMGERSTFLVHLAGTVVGSFTVGGQPPRFWRRSLWREPEAVALGVFGLAVLPSRQRRGTGSWMMSRIEDIARERGCRFVRLDAYEQNPVSVAFYRRLGYEERGRLVVNAVPLLCFEKDVESARSEPSPGPK
jgi:GNAT superfamily N-acetyltransferase